MDELVVLLFRGLFALLGFLLKGLVWTARRGARALMPAQGAGPTRDQLAQAQSGAQAKQAAAKTAATQKPPARPAKARRTPAIDKAERALDELERAARAQAARCAGEDQNDRFVITLDQYVPTTIQRAKKLLLASGEPALPQVMRALEHAQLVLEVVGEMAEQRRDQERLFLLGDADALADACYGPIVEFARGHGIALASERAATMMGDKDLAIFLGFLSTGLAPIILPSAWSTEIGWWPALAHEIGHDFHASIPGFDAELRRRMALPPAGALPDARAGLARRDLDVAWAAWLPEVFADAFGTLMLGPAFIATMIWCFADPADPASVCAAMPTAQRAGYDEHPPGHLRVVLGCRLLARIGFPREADALESEWRKKHKDPESILVPTRQGTFFEVPEAVFLERGEEMMRMIYEEGWIALSGVALRSIPGCDLGPREHQAALDVKAALLDGRRAGTRDPRCLIAGAVLAWKERPSSLARVLKAARATVPSVGVSFRARRLRAERDGRSLAASALDASAIREAFLLGELLSPPPASRLRRRM